MNIDFHQPVTVYALQIGGWLPLPFVSGSMLLVDRNMVSMAKQILNNSLRDDVVANKWWFKFINNSSITLNPILSAMEGNSQRNPTFLEFCEQFDEEAFTLNQAFPATQVTEYSEKHYQAAYDQLSGLGNRYVVEKNFLQDVIPIISTRNKKNKLLSLEKVILQKAKIPMSLGNL